MSRQPPRIVVAYESQELVEHEFRGSARTLVEPRRSPGDRSVSSKSHFPGAISLGRNWTALLNVPRYEATRSPVFHHRGLDRSVGRDPDTAPARGNLYFRFLFVSACLRAPLEGATQGRKAR